MYRPLLLVVLLDDTLLTIHEKPLRAHRMKDDVALNGHKHVPLAHGQTYGQM